MNRTLGVLLRPEWVHILGHILLFAILTYLICRVFQLQNNWQTVILLAMLILLVALMQEFFQLLYKQRAFSGPEVFDLGVDLLGFALGYFLWQRKSKPRKKTA